nr:MAG TPA: hypothetical protein [Caudoviricetes sp.]
MVGITSSRLVFSSITTGFNTGTAGFISFTLFNGV